jgi:uncharacterized protein YaiL (DUF2058 family)
MEDKRNPSDRSRGPRSGGGHRPDRDDRGRGRQGGRRERSDGRDRRPSRGASGPRRSSERRPVKSATMEEDKWSQISEEDFRTRLKELILEANLRETGFGARRFFFATRDGKIPSIDISDDLAGRLIYGQAAIVEVPGEGVREYAIVPSGMVSKIKTVDPEMVRFLNEEY